MYSGQECDATLIRAWLDGDEAAFEALYQRYRRQLYSYLHKLVPGNNALVDDLYQQTWVRALDRLPKYRDNDRFLAWMFRIAHNLAVDHFRRAQRRPHAQLHDHIADHGPTVTEAMQQREREEALADSLEVLNPQQREVWELRAHGVPFKEIARIQGTGVNTVLGRMHYAVNKMRTAVADLR